MCDHSCCTRLNTQSELRAQIETLHAYVDNTNRVNVGLRNQLDAALKANANAVDEYKTALAEKVDDTFRVALLNGMILSDGTRLSPIAVNCIYEWLAVSIGLMPPDLLEGLSADQMRDVLKNLGEQSPNSVADAIEAVLRKKGDGK